MLTFEEKLAVIESFPELTRKDVSLRRVNFHFEESTSDKKNVVYHLHPNGNGFVYAEHLKGYKTDDKGMINIRDFSEEDLRSLIQKSIQQLAAKNEEKEDNEEEETFNNASQDEIWKDRENHTLILKEEGMWNVYAGDNLDGMFRTYKEAIEYLVEEGFSRR